MRESSLKKYVLPYTPPAWFPKRKPTETWTCAFYTLKAVIETKTQEELPLNRYAAWWWSSFSHFMTPRSLLRVLQKFNISHRILRARKLNKTERLQLLKYEITQGPVILATANGLTNKKYFSRRKALTHWHYISLRWFDDEEGCFYIYDSSTKRPVDKNLPIWTVKVPYQYVLKGRDIGYYKIFSSFWIAINYKKSQEKLSLKQIAENIFKLLHF